MFLVLGSVYSLFCVYVNRREALKWHKFHLISFGLFSTIEEARAEAQLLDVAMRHASLIKMYRSGVIRSANFHFCFYLNSCSRIDHFSLFN